jgi:hypothetical protein
MSHPLAPYLEDELMREEQQIKKIAERLSAEPVGSSGYLATLDLYDAELRVASAKAAIYRNVLAKPERLDHVMEVTRRNLVSRLAVGGTGLATPNALAGLVASARVLTTVARLEKEHKV